MVENNRGIIAKIKRLVLVADGLTQMEEGMELAIGQLTYLAEQEKTKRSGVSVQCIEYTESEGVIRAEIDYLRTALRDWQDCLLRRIAAASDKRAHELESPTVLAEIDEILKEKK